MADDDVLDSQAQPPVGEQASGATSRRGGARYSASEPPDQGTVLAYKLIRWMLIALFVLLSALLAMALVASKLDPLGDTLEFYKSGLAVLLGAFGAWIGAGAAYFFGRENLKESRRTTAEALKLQGEALKGDHRPEQIKDLNLTTMNTEFLFTPSSTVREVREQLGEHPAYWFVPELDSSRTGTLQDVIASGVFWDGKIDDTTKISEVVSRMDGDDKLKSLHGTSFFLRASPDDPITDILNRMSSRHIEVGIVVDKGRRPTHCFTQTDLKRVVSA